MKSAILAIVTLLCTPLSAADKPNIIDVLDDALASDIGETRNVAAHPDTAAKLELLMTDARTENPDFPLIAKSKNKMKP